MDKADTGHLRSEAMMTQWLDLNALCARTRSCGVSARLACRRAGFARAALIVTTLTLMLPGAPSHARTQQFVNSVGMAFVLIPAGTFTMGSPPEEAFRRPSEVQRRVTISRPFYMQTTAVTANQWETVMGRSLFARRRGAGDMPVVRVSWHDCQQFIRRLNAMTQARYTLPTEAQWEYAARAGSTTAYFWGDAADCAKAMFANNPGQHDDCVPFNRSHGRPVGGPERVKRYPPNAWGLYDMHGNVWEWCLDRFGIYDTTAVTDPCQTDTGRDRVRRSGSWFSPGHACRSANRAYGHPMSRLQNTGFRLVMAVVDEPRTDPGPSAPGNDQMTP